jgi:pyruvate-formate lyase-activating enzyme
MASGQRISWASTDRYSPVQDRVGIHDPDPGELPSVINRVEQHPDPYAPEFLDGREILRVTYQGDDRCQLRCPGCYTGERLARPGIAPAEGADPRPDSGPARRLRSTFDDFTGHLQGLGPGLQDFYLLGAEPTMDPEGSAARLAWAVEHGLTIMSITNGAVSPDRFDRTFGAAADSGELYKLIVSLDSIDPEINNLLRGAAFAFDRTVATIRRCVERGLPVKVQVTVWPRNYPTVMDTVEALWDMGVRGFAFHCGSVEGVPGFLGRGLDHIDPLPWRALCERLYEFRAAHRDELFHFNFPLLYFTEAELRATVIGDEALADAYLAHVAALEAGRDSAKPFHACPGLDVPQVYVYGNDGANGRGIVSLCNVHSPEGEAAFADYDPGVRRWRVVQDPARNQMQRMIDSPHLCPAMPGATGGRSSDRVGTERGNLYHACRYLGCNQVPVDQHQFGREAYDDAITFYRALAAAEAARGGGRQSEPYLARVRRLTRGTLRLRDRAVAVLRDAVDNAGLALDALPTVGFPAELLDAVRAAGPLPADPPAGEPALGQPRAAEGGNSGGAVPLPFPVWSVGGKLDEPARACGGCR